jgi:hypothetical protein
MPQAHGGPGMYAAPGGHDEHHKDASHKEKGHGSMGAAAGGLAVGAVGGALVGHAIGSPRSTSSLRNQ